MDFLRPCIFCATFDFPCSRCLIIFHLLSFLCTYSWIFFLCLPWAQFFTRSNLSGNLSSLLVGVFFLSWGHLCQSPLSSSSSLRSLCSVSAAQMWTWNFPLLFSLEFPPSLSCVGCCALGSPIFPFSLFMCFSWSQSGGKFCTPEIKVIILLSGGDNKSSTIFFFWMKCKHSFW